MSNLLKDSDAASYAVTSTPPTPKKLVLLHRWDGAASAGQSFDVPPADRSVGCLWFNLVFTRNCGGFKWAGKGTDFAWVRLDAFNKSTVSQRLADGQTQTMPAPSGWSVLNLWLLPTLDGTRWVGQAEHETEGNGQKTFMRWIQNPGPIMFTPLAFGTYGMKVRGVVR
jgi:hypothetical protein